uniref:PPM-type phosphatase domain-containing protein n=1 Tax=Steinernema glaseri TaxID=37863 RepID=A0A1I7YQ53_9BILA
MCGGALLEITDCARSPLLWKCKEQVACQRETKFKTRRRPMFETSGLSAPSVFSQLHVEIDDITSTPSKMVPDICIGSNLRITASASQGGRRYMEDRIHIEYVRNEEGAIDWVYCAVYDGHGGPEASEFVRRNLLNNIRKSPNFNTDNDDEFLEIIRQGFVQTHYSMLKVVDSWPKTSSGYSCTAGTTASCAFIRRGKLYTGHVGDSAIFLGMSHEGDDYGQRLESVRLTIDHKPDSPEELHRIESAGGAVMNKAGINRVVWNRPRRGHVGPITVDTPVENIPFLAVARALGDLWSYSHLTGEYVVSPDPDVSVVPLDRNVKCMVLGSDGLTNVMNPQQMMDTVSIHEWKDLAKMYGPAAEERILDRPIHNNHAQWLLRQAMRNWGGLRADNISVVVVLFDDLKSDLPDDHISVTHSGRDLVLDEELTNQPDAMVRVTNRTVQRLRTTPVDLAYSGMMDKNFKYAGYKGPGFVMPRNVREGSEERAVPPRHRSLRNLMSSASSSCSEPALRINAKPTPTPRIIPFSPTPTAVKSTSALPEALLPSIEKEDELPFINGSQDEITPADMSIIEEALMPTEGPEPTVGEPNEPEPTSTALAEERPESRMDNRPEEDNVETSVIVNEEPETNTAAKENGEAEKHGGNCERAILLNEEYQRKRELRDKQKLEAKSLNNINGAAEDTEIEHVNGSEEPVSCLNPKSTFKSDASGDAPDPQPSATSAGLSPLATIDRFGPADSKLGMSPSAMLTVMRAASFSSINSGSNLPPATVTPFRTLSLDSPVLQGVKLPVLNVDTPVIRNGRRFTRVDAETSEASKPSVQTITPGHKRQRLSKTESDTHIEPHHKRSRVMEFFHSVTGLLGVGGHDKRGDKSGAK